MSKKNVQKERTCADCIHEYACQMWNVGTLHFADASSCANYEVLKDSTAYYIGYQDGREEREGNDNGTDTVP